MQPSPRSGRLRLEAIRTRWNASWRQRLVIACLEDKGQTTATGYRNLPAPGSSWHCVRRKAVYTTFPLDPRLNPLLGAVAATMGVCTKPGPVTGTRDLPLQLLSTCTGTKGSKYRYIPSWCCTCILAWAHFQRPSFSSEVRT
ncbi:hypothetical protein N656DRAFT_297114 [Canariomyces notabilis]|uniref:Uncharacterized protein n=1 Tax=Canariomyces notabilis TaxID=2074819 RepID=A0AAN6TAI4_9PEZI|nr:hypothetical protein N656DRAFT_297114 [Canariomyces arenarius]